MAAWAAVLAAPAHAEAAPAAPETVSVPLRQAVADLPVADEDRTGYRRSEFRHWVDEDRDGCSTRAEVLLEEAVTPLTVGERCRISGGEWDSYYDGERVADASGLDIDHVVPLAEAWDSGASEWSAERRMRYANDLGDPRALVAVTARQNRSKADQDPAEWLPALPDAHCRYVAEWTAVKLRWGLTADTREREALTALAGGCPDETLTVETAP
ncbi:HNH endonuclease [Marinitenerispora sediminis]|uniref:HNH endonuclease n=2 Tax=Marinitenerispora sediminis TaxID=1931232 RepID=A0A368SYP7_9ACTN|nr:HNH endonuclease family protein [Marinitenerispora sediminis]RCV49735.1 HNH endonuclease [Marinitenerispora sediminis]RCV52131.1 HNH endonuclease [Marinitenerispora sediminis]RCV57843.1 HNH endonuclease [Marinitenerispora sediminis]